VFSLGARWVAHRVVEDRGSELLCRGDGNEQTELIRRADVVFVVIGRSGCWRVLDLVPNALESRVGTLVRGLRSVRRMIRARAAG